MCNCFFFWLIDIFVTGYVIDLTGPNYWLARIFSDENYQLNYLAKHLIFSVIEFMDIHSPLW